MAETGVPPNLDLFDEHDEADLDEAGNLGLHLGVLRRFARLARAESPAPARPVTDR
ncbi:MAG TPA: hypothetical protein VJ622_03050 [Acidimicrobiia bacterium]|nr:hypothetical protein [Acidimicrobiia bacterium]